MGLEHTDGRYFHLLSGQDYPLKPLEDFLRFFDTDNREFIEGAHLPAPHWDGNTYQRIQYFFFNDWLKLSSNEDIQKLWKFADTQEKWGIRRRIPDQVKHIYGGSTWFSLTRDCSYHVLEYSRKCPSLLWRFRFTFAPDEIYIHTVVRHIEFKNKQIGYGNLRCVHWEKNGDNHPIDFNESHFHELSSSGAFFARKFEQPDCAKVLSLIDKYLLVKEKVTTSETGSWMTKTFSGHFYDAGLSMAIGRLCKICKIRNAIDFGCGPGWYVSALRKQRVAAVGYDGNPHTAEFSRLLEELTNYPCEQADLTEKLVVEEPYDMTLCLSVGEYIPREYEEQVWQNLIDSTNRYLIISWGTPDICEETVINPHTEKEIRDKSKLYGLEVDELATRMLRDGCWVHRYRNSVLVLRK